MKFGNVEGERVQAIPNAKGSCTVCESDMIAKCGEKYVWHWSHKGKRHCDIWWENETEWHRAWKNHFPEEWQEVVHRADDGEKHIADVKTDQGWVLEFQHSLINPEECQAREAYYQKMLWVVDGTRRKRDRKQFFRAIEEGMFFHPKPKILKVEIFDCVLLKDWAGSKVPVFLDFGETENPEADTLWCLLPTPVSRYMYVVEYSRVGFIRLHRDGPPESIDRFAGFIADLSNKITSEILRIRKLEAIEHAKLAQRLHRPRPRRHFRL